MQQIRVGPESAGSEPGPACYGRGGEQPAVTDADLILGKLDPENFAGGSIPLHPEASQKALTTHIGKALEMEAVEAAWGLAEVVDENMANAARVHAVENGEDLSDYTMIAFGGAAPLHAARLCEKLGVDRCLIPVGAGVGSAIGFLRASFSFEANRSVFMRLSAFDRAKAKSLFTEMTEEATRFVRFCDDAATILADYKVYMRYSGQGWEIPIQLTAKEAADPKAETLLKHFEDDYEKLFGRSVDGMEVEITVWSVNAYTEQNATSSQPTPKKLHQLNIDQYRDVLDPSKGKMAASGIISRDMMTEGAQVAGPCVITEDETSIIIPGSYNIVAHSDGTLDMTVKSGM
jgi:N-methylhydantoinase A